MRIPISWKNCDPGDAVHCKLSEAAAKELIAYASPRGWVVEIADDLPCRTGVYIRLIEKPKHGTSTDL